MAINRADDAEYVAMIAQLREFLDVAAAARPDVATITTLRQALQSWIDKLRRMAVPEKQRVFGRAQNVPGRSQTMCPIYTIERADTNSISAKASFGPYFLGGNGAAHGGSVALIFDDLLGRLASSGDRKRCRTAYLHIDYRSITPIETPLDLRGWFVSEEGRKRVIRGELRDGPTLCAEAEGLFIELRPDQP